jgi:hypothetical protein
MVPETVGASTDGDDPQVVTPSQVATPRMVKIVAGGVALLGVLNIVRIIVQTALTFTGSEWSVGARAMFLLLNAIPFAVSVFCLPLAYLLLRGRLWSWITAVVLVTLSSLVGGLTLLVTLIGDGSPLPGLAIFGVAVGVLLGLVVPGSVRAFFVGQPTLAPFPTFPGHGPWAP